jgi:RluA family pseudouridine synthase
MLVKIKREIIAFGVDGIDPREHTSRRVSPRELKRWLDEGRPVTLLDTRNDFEVEAGTFENARAIGVDDFRNFPAAVRQLPTELKERPIVTFCTGGIRCEKATPFLEREGFRDVYQLDGGILKYLEECGGAHYRGHCFIFDKRVALDANLQPGDLRQCFACQTILSPAECAAPEYVEGVSCPRCYRSPLESLEALLRRRAAAIRAATNPLPGSAPYENVRPISVPLEHDGLEVLDFFEAMKTHLARDEWRQACIEGRVVCRGEVVAPGRIVRSGERLLHTMPAASEPDVAATIEILHEDEAIVVVNKPAPLPMHPCGRFNRNSLAFILDQVYHPLGLRPAHRLDADTSGVVVFSKTRQVASRVQPQFEMGEVRKSYVARVHGRPDEAEFECHTPLSAMPGPGGARLAAADGAPARTRFRVLRQEDQGIALVLAEPLTGRTNQIRVHLWNLGLPIMGDPIYLRDGRLGVPQALSLTDPPLCLHAAAISFVHPTTAERVWYEAPLPAWAKV